MPIAHVVRQGIRLCVEWSGTDPAFVFAHGLSGSRLQSQRLVGPLAVELRVITFDQRGHGDSRAVVGLPDFDPEDMAGDIIAILDALGVERAAVGGTSMGAATALLCALNYPERVDKLLLVAPAFGDQPNPARSMLEAIGHEVSGGGVEAYIARLRQEDWPAAGMSEEAMALRAAILRSHDAANIAAACKEVAGWVLLPDLAPLAHVAIPTQIIAWDGDAVHPWALAERMADILPQAQLVCSSLQSYHNEPGLVARLARTFLMAT